MPKTHRVQRHVNKPAAAHSRAQAGWTVPVDTQTLKQWIESAEHDLELWKNELYNRQNAGRLQAIADIRNIRQLWVALGDPIRMDEIVNAAGNPIKSRKKRK